MRKVVVKLWNDFEDNRWNELIESMPKRIEEVIKARGGSTSY